MTKKMTKEEDKKQEQEQNIAQLQLAEQNIQNLLLQKQMFQFELIEINNALEELEKSKDGDVFKVVGSLMFKSNKPELKKDLEKKRDIINLRIKTIEKQEEAFKSRLLKTRDELIKGMKGPKKH